MESATFEAFRELIYDASGINLNQSKQSLVAARLGKRVRALGLDSPEMYLEFVTGNDGELVALLDAVSTNVTSFFRESDHFDVLGTELAAWGRSGQRRLRMWSAACSTGEEPYTMAMVARAAVSADVSVRILATDISTQVLGQASRGRYGADKVEKVPVSMRQRWMRKAQEGEEIVYDVSPELRQQIVFKRLNLAQPPFPMKGPLEAVLCRNVMIYFDHAVRQRLVTEIERLLRPGGLFLVGHSESLNGLRHAFQALRPSVYRREA